MARPLRIEFPGAFYLVMNRGLERRAIFLGPKDYQDFLALCARAHEAFRVVLHAYALLPTHYQLFVETPQGHLSRVMRQVDGVYTQTFNRRYGRVGPLFHGRYKALLVDQEHYALDLARYIHLNPVRAGLAARPDGYRWSSYRAYLGKDPPGLGVETAWLLSQSGPSPVGAREAFRRYTAERPAAVWEPAAATRGGVVLGSEAFRTAITQRCVGGTRDGEPTGVRTLQKAPALDPLVQAVEALTPDARLRRKLLAYALRRFTPLSLKEVGTWLRGMRDQAVAQTVARLVAQRQRDAGLDQLLVRLEATCCQM